MRRVSRSGVCAFDPFSTPSLGLAPGWTLGSRGEILTRGSFACVDERRLILVVEDDEATRAFLLDNLAADGFRVAGAGGLGESLRAIEVRQPTLVVLDLALEDGSGLELLDRVRAADGLASRLDPDLPVIVLTGRSGEADRVRSFDRGADDHLSKPTCRFPQRVISGRAPGSVIWSSVLHFNVRGLRAAGRCGATSERHADGSAVDTTRPSSRLIIRRSEVRFLPGPPRETRS
jgi:CheY-like chemotaxis protein